MMRKRIISAAIGATVVLGGATGAYASNSNTQKVDLPTKITKLQGKQQQVQTKKAALGEKTTKLANKPVSDDAFKNALNEKKKTFVANQSKNNDMHSQNNELRLQIAQLRLQLKNNGVKIPADIKAALQQDKQQIKMEANILKEGKGQLKTLMQNNKEAIKNKDSAAIDAAFSKAYSIQAQRYQSLSKINGNLQNVFKVLSTLTTGSTITTPSTGSGTSL